MFGPFLNTLSNLSYNMVYCKSIYQNLKFLLEANIFKFRFYEACIRKLSLLFSELNIVFNGIWLQSLAIHIAKTIKFEHNVRWEKRHYLFFFRVLAGTGKMLILAMGRSFTLSFLLRLRYFSKFQFFKDP